MSSECAIHFLEIYIETEKAFTGLNFQHSEDNLERNRWSEVELESESYKQISQFRGYRKFHTISVANLHTAMEAEGNEATVAKGSGDNLQLRQEFFSGNPSVETSEGIIHLYKVNEPQNKYAECERPTMLCMLSVPAHMTSKDLISFTAPFCDFIEELKVVQDGTPNQYMVLLKFNEQRAADNFHEAKNGVKFNSFDPEICQLVYVSVVESVKPSSGACFPLKDVVELPNCPVCLERMEESVEGILTILCNHSYHTSCIARTEELICPVCRYVHTPERAGDNRCGDCGVAEHLWICLICGNVGCGRYAESHAKRHFENSGHTFALQDGKDRVWDYASDNYVHRIVQNKSDGKLVEIDGAEEEECDKKLNSVTMEYTYLLTSQLESQRAFFEEEMKRREDVWLRKIEELESKGQQQDIEVNELRKRLENITSEKKSVEKKYANITAKQSKVQSSLEEEKEINKSLLKNQNEWSMKLEKTEQDLKVEREARQKEVSELQDQLRDLMFYLEAKEKLAQSEDLSQVELEGSSVSMPAEEDGGATGARRKKLRKGQKR